jgi:hypothetical protein
MTEKSHSEEYRKMITDEGMVTYDWESSKVRIQVEPYQVERDGRYVVRCWHNDASVSSGRVRLDHLADREKLHAHCAALDGDTPWLQFLTAVSADLRELPAIRETRTLAVTRLDMVTPAAVRFWWKPFLPKGRPVSLEGDPGVGKSTLAIKIAAHLTAGRGFPTVLDNEPPQRDYPPENVCWLSSEDDPADTLRPRMEINGGDPSRLFLVEGWTKPDGERGGITMQDLALIEQALEAYHPALLVLDPIQSFFGLHVDTNRSTDTRPILDALCTLCQSYGTTPLLVRHVGKTPKDRAIYSGLGSIDISARMRSIVFLGADPENDERRIVAHAKSNNARVGQSLAYRVVSTSREIFLPDGGSVSVEAPQVQWDGLSPLTADALAGPRKARDEEEEEEDTAINQAKQFLLEILSDGPVLSSEVNKAAKQAAMSAMTLRRAKTLLNVSVHCRKNEGPSSEWPWEWELSEEEMDDEV